MAALYPEELRSIADYVRLVPRLRAAMGPHVADLLRAGLSAVLDWPANTRTSRAWMRGVFEAAGAAHRLHVLDVPDKVCLARLAARNAGGIHEYQVSEAEFAELARHFEQPALDEGFDVVVNPPRWPGRWGSASGRGFGQDPSKRGTAWTAPSEGLSRVRRRSSSGWPRCRWCSSASRGALRHGGRVPCYCAASPARS